MSEHQVPRTPQPLYSPTLALSDFYLFPTVNNRIVKIHTVDIDDLSQQLLETLQLISVDELERAVAA
jgi:hypothetical protein